MCREQNLSKQTWKQSMSHFREGCPHSPYVVLLYRPLLDKNSTSFSSVVFTGIIVMEKKTKEKSIALAGGKKVNLNSLLYKQECA